jgi:hypothetical protein
MAIGNAKTIQKWLEPYLETILDHNSDLQEVEEA